MSIAWYSGHDGPALDRHIADGHEDLDSLRKASAT